MGYGEMRCGATRHGVVEYGEVWCGATRHGVVK